MLYGADKPCPVLGPELAHPVGKKDDRFIYLLLSVVTWPQTGIVYVMLAQRKLFAGYNTTVVKRNKLAQFYVSELVWNQTILCSMLIDAAGSRLSV